MRYTIISIEQSHTFNSLRYTLHIILTQSHTVWKTTSSSLKFERLWHYHWSLSCTFMDKITLSSSLNFEVHFKFNHHWSFIIIEVWGTFSSLFDNLMFEVYFNNSSLKFKVQYFHHHWSLRYIFTIIVQIVRGVYLTSKDWHNMNFNFFFLYLPSILFQVVIENTHLFLPCLWTKKTIM